MSGWIRGKPEHKERSICKLTSGISKLEFRYFEVKVQEFRSNISAITRLLFEINWTMLDLWVFKHKAQEVIRAGPARGNQGAAGIRISPGSLNNFLCSSRTGALGEIGLGGRAS